MSITALIESDVSDVFINTADFGESVTREICGVEVDTEVQNALVDPDAVELDTTNGRTIKYQYAMLVAETSAPTEADAYIVRNERCRVVKVGKAQHGLVSVWLQRVEGIRAEARRTRAG